MCRSRRLGAVSLGAALCLSYAAPAFADDVPSGAASAVGAYVESLPTASGAVTSAEAAKSLAERAAAPATQPAPEPPGASTPDTSTPDASTPDTSTPDTSTPRPEADDEQPDAVSVGADRPTARPLPAELPPVPGLGDAAGASLDALGGGRVLVIAAAFLAMTGLAFRAARGTAASHERR